MGYRFSTKKIGDDYYVNDFIKANISDYDLLGMSNGTVPEIPNVDLYNPMAMLYASEINSDGEADTSILPSIGVEFLDSDEVDRNFIGESETTEKITTSFLNSIQAVPIKDRFAIGIFLSDDTINELKTIIDNRTTPLYATKFLRIEEIKINISIWATSKEQSRLVIGTIRSLCEFMKKDMSKRGVKDVKWSTSGAMYNYDFGETLYGGEIKLTYKNHISDWYIDESIERIDNIEITGDFETKDSGDTYSRTITT